MDEVEAAAGAVREARGALAEAERRRDEAIRTALEQGVPVTQIASATGLTRMRVYQVRDGRR